MVKKCKNSYIYTKDNKKYLDMFSGISVNNLGHCNKKIRKNLIRYSKKYFHLSNFFYNECNNKLSNLLYELTGFKYIFYSNSGTESIEAAIKLCKKYGYIYNKKDFYYLENSFHGRTYGSLSLSYNKKDYYKDYLNNFYSLKFNDLDDLKNKVNDDTACVFLELLQGSSGINLVSKDYIDLLKELRNKFNFLIVIDEVQTGLYRTGYLFLYEYFNIYPDILCLAKSLGGGLPLGCVLTNLDLFIENDHGSTFGGNPLSCICGYTYLKEITKDKFIKKLKNKIKYFWDNLLLLKNKYNFELRGIGLMIGIKINNPLDIKNTLLKENILINITNNIIRLLPNYNMKYQEIDYFIDKFEYALNKKG